MSSRALVIVGHGSARNPGTRKPICRAVQAIRETGLFDEIRCGLWKEDPHVSVTLDKVVSDEIYVVPFFISDGYYTRVKIPEEMNLSGALTHEGTRRIHYTKAVGSHASLGDVLAVEVRASNLDPGDSVVVLGHGTPRNPDSATNVYLQAERLRRQCPWVEVVTLFIDQDPNMLEVFERTHGKQILMIPLFVANGWHVTETIPEDLGMGEGRLERDGRVLHYASAVGEDANLWRVVLQRVVETAGVNDAKRFSPYLLPAG